MTKKCPKCNGTGKRMEQHVINDCCGSMQGPPALYECRFCGGAGTSDWLYEEQDNLKKKLAENERQIRTLGRSK